MAGFVIAGFVMAGFVMAGFVMAGFVMAGSFLGHYSSYRQLLPAASLRTVADWLESRKRDRCAAFYVALQQEAPHSSHLASIFRALVPLTLLN
ncbi:MAG: hypothetical protein WAU57_06125 [Xanthobacteraceae bacterium]